MGGFKKVLGAAAPIIGTAVGGPLGGAIGGAAGGLLSGAPQQAEKDSAQARQLAGEAVDSSKRGARGATQQFGLNAPLRDAFRTGALAQADPTNPFSRDIFGGFANLLQQESGPQGVGTGFEAQAPQAPQMMEDKGGLGGRFARFANERAGSPA